MPLTTGLKHVTQWKIKYYTRHKFKFVHMEILKTEQALFGVKSIKFIKLKHVERSNSDESFASFFLGGGGKFFFNQTGWRKIQTMAIASCDESIPTIHSLQFKDRPAVFQKLARISCSHFITWSVYLYSKNGLLSCRTSNGEPSRKFRFQV